MAAMSERGPRLTHDALLDVLITPGTSGTVVYDYGILREDLPRTLHCPCGRTDQAGGAEDVIAAHLAGAPAGTRAAILVRPMASDGTAGAAALYAVAERTEDSIIWPTHPGQHVSPDPGSTTIARTA